MNTQESIAIAVVCATPAKQLLVRLNVRPGTTARQAIETAMIADEFPDLDISRLTLGIYGEVVADDCILQPGDRVEIYRPLINEPRKQRRLQVARARKASAVSRKTRVPGS
jgi:uncharacterized protein